MTDVSPGDETTIAERGGHIKGRPISWVVVTIVCGGFLAAGIGVVLATLWLFYLGAGIVVLGTILGWATHAMADVTARVETTHRRAHAAEIEPVGAETPSSQVRATPARQDEADAGQGVRR